MNCCKSRTTCIMNSFIWKHQYANMKQSFQLPEKYWTNSGKVWAIKTGFKIPVESETGPFLSQKQNPSQEADSIKYIAISGRTAVNQGLPPQHIIAATKREMSLSSNSKALNFMAKSNFGSMISQNGFLKLLRNSRVMKPFP